MKDIAVIGLRDSQQFRAWGYQKVEKSKRKEIKQLSVVDKDNGIEYHFIAGENDIRGMMFDEIIDLDPFRDYLKNRIK